MFFVVPRRFIFKIFIEDFYNSDDDVIGNRFNGTHGFHFSFYAVFIMFLEVSMGRLRYSIR